MKFAELPKCNVRGRVLEVENAIVESISITNDEHGFLLAWLFTKFGCSGCGFGGYVLGKGDGGNLIVKGRKNYCAEFIVRCLIVTGTMHWEKIPKSPIRVLHEGLGGGIVAIGHFLKDEWFCPRIEFEEQIQQPTPKKKD